MATSIFSPFQSITSLFSKKKKQEPNYFPTDWSQARSVPTQTPKQTTQYSQSPSWQSKPAQSQTYFPTSWRSATTARTTPTTNRGASGSWTQEKLTPFQQMVANKQQPQQQQQPGLPQADPTGTSALIQRAREIAQRRAGFYSDQADRRVAQLDETQGIRQKYADERVAKLEGLRDKAIARIQETIPLQEQTTAEYKTQVEDQSGRELKEQAQAQREEQQGIQDLFAGLNTIDSGAFITQGMKSRERLTANQTATIKARTNELNAANRDLKLFKLEAQQKITDEVTKFDDVILQIAENMEVGSAEYNAAVQQVYDQAQEAILGIEAGLSEKELAYEEKAQALQQELLLEQAKAGQGTELKDKQAMSLSANNALDDLIMTINGNEGIYKNLNPLDQSKRDYDAKVNNAIDLIIRTRTGAAATKQEVDAMRGMFPSFMDSKETAMVKLSRLKSGVQSSLLGTPYGDTQASAVPNSTNDPLGLFL